MIIFQKFAESHGLSSSSGSSKNTPKALAIFSPAVGAQRQPWDLKSKWRINPERVRQLGRLCTKSSSMKKMFHAKAQSAAAFLCVFFCTFAPLRENTFTHGPEQNSEDFSCKAGWACARLTLSGFKWSGYEATPGLSLRSNRWAEVSERLRRIHPGCRCPIAGLKLANAFGVYN
jgi:hypothetical protein